MRQFHPCQPQRPQQQQQQQQHAGVQQAQPRAHGAHGPDASPRAAAPAIDDTLDQAAALWTTRRIRSYFRLLDPSAGTPRR